MTDVNSLETYVRTFAPKAYSKIQNPTTYFQQLQQELTARRRQIIQPTDEWSPVSEEDIQNPTAFAGRRRAQYNAAAEMAWQEIVYDRFPAEVDETGAPLDPDQPQM